MGVGYQWILNGIENQYATPGLSYRQDSLKDMEQSFWVDL